MSEPDLDFLSLRGEGLRHLQDLTGDGWTDYNLHDPGVTLLEVLVYGLTDLAYRVDFPPEELLAGKDGLDLVPLGLKVPEAALPTRPTTADDLRGAILDRVTADLRREFGDVGSGLENVWVRPAAALKGSDRSGLVDILVWTGHGKEASNPETVLLRTRQAFDRLRIVGEDADRVAFVREVRCRLRADVEIERDRDPSEIAAEIYLRCAELLARGVRPTTLDERRRQGLPLDGIFDGPLGHYGMYDPKELKRAAQGVRPSDLTSRHKRGAPQAFFRAVGSIPDILFVRSLTLEALGEPPLLDALEPTVVELALPLAPGMRQVDGESTITASDITLQSRGRNMPIDPERMLQHFERLHLEEARGLRLEQHVDSVIDRPTATYRDFAEYTLVQDHLPQVYRVSQRGLPKSATVAQQARSRQLRGFLLQFEQMQADFLANLGALDGLLALSGAAPTYRSSVEVQDLLPAPERDLYLTPDGPKTALEAYDDVFDRRGRVLDYLMALYGEAFSQNSLRTFDIYRSADERWKQVLANRERFIHDIDRLIDERGAAPNLSGGRASTLNLFDPSDREIPENPEDAVVPPTNDGADLLLDELLLEMQANGQVAAGLVDSWLLENGIYLERYRLLPAGARWTLLLQSAPVIQDESDARQEAAVAAIDLGTFDDRSGAIAAANRLWRALIGMRSSGDIDPGGFARRLALLLDLRLARGNMSLGTALSAHDLEWPGTDESDCARLDPFNFDEREPPANPLEGLVPLTDDGSSSALDDLIEAVRKDGHLPAGSVDPWLFENGIRIEHYRLMPAGTRWTLVLETAPSTAPSEPQVQPRAADLGTFDDRHHAVAVANRLRRALIGLCSAGEGFHLVEHVLLRHRDPPHCEADIETDHDIADALLRITIVLPAWTPRLRDPGFQKLVEETVALNCPAHVATDFLWIGDAPGESALERMTAFEFEFDEWRRCLKLHLVNAAAAEAGGRPLEEAAQIVLDELNQASGALRSRLQSTRRR